MRNVKIITHLSEEVDKQVNIIISDANAQAEEIVAQGESEYMKLLSEAFNTKEKEEFYIFMRSLETLEASLKGEKKTIILGSDSELAKILQGLE